MEFPVSGLAVKSISFKYFSHSENNKMVNVPQIILNNGEKMPSFGLGTYLFRGGEAICMIKKSIEIGYRHFDTAFLYNNELEVGEGIRAKIADGTVTRSDIFISTKMWSTYHAPEKVEFACRNSLKNLDLNYIDLFLMHFPVSLHFESDEMMWPKCENGLLHVTDIDYLETWQAMEDLVDAGLVKSIGVSNFNSAQLERIIKFGRIKPVVNQIECCPILNQRKMIQFCRERDIFIIAYCPLRHMNKTKELPSFLCDERVQQIANKFRKTTVQICLRYLIELGTVPIPKSICADHLRSNIEIFDFKLTENEIQIMHSFNTDDRLLKMCDFKHSKHWPFSIEF